MGRPEQKKRKKKGQMPSKPARNYQPVFGLAIHPMTLESAFGSIEPHDFGRDPRFGDEYFV